MIFHGELTGKELVRLIRKGDILFAGNCQLKIFGLLNCKSGMRMKRRNRVFFNDEKEAMVNGYRPCAHCQHEKYLQWKLRKKQVE